MMPAAVSAADRLATISRASPQLIVRHSPPTLATRKGAAGCSSARSRNSVTRLGAASMRDYAAGLRRRLAFDGLVVAVAPNRATGVAGPRSQAAMRLKLGAIAPSARVAR